MTMQADAYPVAGAAQSPVPGSSFDDQTSCLA